MTSDQFARVGSTGSEGFGGGGTSEPRSTDQGSTYAIQEPQVTHTQSPTMPDFEEMEEEDEFESEETGGV